MIRFIALAAFVNAEQTIKYVFEIVRHGARAPLMADTGRFDVSDPGMLTPQGMR